MKNIPITPQLKKMKAHHALRYQGNAFLMPYIDPQQVGLDSPQLVKARKQVEAWCRKAKGQIDPQVVSLKPIKITPTMAAAMLERNLYNRRPKPATISRYRIEMAIGEWLCSNTCISFDCNGYLVDGQHTLMAVCESGIAILAQVQIGVDPYLFFKLDQGPSRSGGDLVNSSTGKKNGAALFQCMKTILMLEEYPNIALPTNLHASLGINDRSRTTQRIQDWRAVDEVVYNTAFQDFYEKNAATYGKLLSVPSSVIGAVHWKMHLSHPVVADQLIDDVCIQDMVSATSNAGRVIAMINKRTATQQKTNRAWWMAWFIDAFNGELQGKKVAIRQVKGRSFPTIL
jgi:hypothetical protein